MIKKCTHMLLKSTILGLIVFSIPLESLHGDETPWRTAQGRQCIEQWMQLVETQINASDLGPNSNLRKPWRFNKYGILLGRKSSSAYAPDDFNRYENIHHYVWTQYYRKGSYWGPSRPLFRRSNVPCCREYVRQCLNQPGGGSIDSNNAQLRSAQYARRALDQYQENLRLGCRYTGSRWRDNYNYHYNWALQQSQETLDRESKRRDDELNRCRRSQ